MRCCLCLPLPSLFFHYFLWFMALCIFDCLWVSPPLSRFSSIVPVFPCCISCQRTFWSAVGFWPKKASLFNFTLQFLTVLQYKSFIFPYSYRMTEEWPLLCFSGIFFFLHLVASFCHVAGSRSRLSAIIAQDVKLKGMSLRSHQSGKRGQRLGIMPRFCC